MINFKVTPYLYMNIVGFRRAEFTLVDYPPVDDKVATPLKSSGRLKQEVKTTQIIDFRRISYTVNREIKRIEEIVSKVVKNYLEEEKNKSFSIDDYWDLSSLSDEQIQSLYTDLLVFVRGNAYGDKLQCVDNKVEVFEAIENTLVNIMK